MPSRRLRGPPIQRAIVRTGAALALLVALVLVPLGLWAQSDARLTRLVRAQLQRALPGRINVGNVHWTLPLQFVVQDGVLLDEMHHAPTVQWRVLSTRLSLRSLLRGHITLGPTTLQGLEVLVADDGAKPEGAAADANQQVNSQADGATLSQAVAQVLARLPGITVTNLHLHQGRLAVLGPSTLVLANGIDGALDLQGDGAGSAVAEVRLSAATLGISKDGRSWQRHNVALVARRLQLAAPNGPNGGLNLSVAELALMDRGLDVALGARVHLAQDDSLTAQMTGGLGVTLDDAFVQQLLDDPARRAVALTGGLRAQLDATAQGSLRASPILQGAEGTLRLQGSQLGILHVPLGGACVWGSWTSGKPLHVQAQARWDDASSMALDATATPQSFAPGIGEHAVSLVLQNLAVADLAERMQPLSSVVPAWRPGLRQLAANAPWLPRSVNLRLHGEGSSLWPDPNTRWAVTAQGTGIAGTQKLPLPAAAQPISVSLVATAQKAGLELENLDVVFGKGRIVVHARGDCGWDAKKPARLKVTADTLRLAALLSGAQAPLTADRMRLTVGLSGTPDAPKGHGALQLFAVNLLGKGKKVVRGKGPKQDGVTLGNLTLPFNFSGGVLAAKGATLAGEALHAGVTGFVQLFGLHNAALPEHSLNLELRLTSPDVERLMQRPHEARTPSKLSGLIFVGGTLEAPELTADLHGAGPLGHSSAWATADASGALLRKWTLAPAGGGVLWAEGAWLRKQEQVALTLAGSLPNASGNQAATVSGSLNGTLTSGLALRLAAESQQSHLLATGTLMPQTQHLDLQVASTASLTDLGQYQSAWAAAKPTGHINAQLRLTGAMKAPHVIGTLLATGLGLSGRTLGSGRVQASVQTPEGNQYHLEVRAPKALTADIDVYPWAPGGVGIEADISHFALAALYPPISIAGADVQGDAIMRLRLSRRTLLPTGTVTLRHLTASARGQAMALEEPTVVRLDGRNAGIGRLRMSGQPGRLALEGHWGQVVRASVAGNIALGFVTPFVPALTYARGELTLDAKLSGRRSDPQLEANIQVTQPTVIRPRGSPIELRLAAGTISLTPSALRINNLRGGIEGGSFVFSGEVGLRNRKPTAFALRLDGHGIPVRQGDLMVEGNVALACTGPGNHPVVKGTVDIIGGRYLRALELRDFSFVGQPVDVSLPAAYQAPWLKDVGLDVHTVSHDGVDIAINASAFAIRARVETDLHIGGNVLDPRLTGKVQAREGTIAFPRADLLLSQASIDFETARRSAKNPVGAEVVLRAAGEVVPSGTDSENYQVSMNLDGPPEALSLDLSSDNGKLNKLAVLSLLSTGNVDLAMGARSGDDAAKLETAEALVGSLLTAPLSRFAQKKIEQVFNVNVDLAIKTSDGAVTVVAAKNINRRLRLEGAYSHGVGLTNTDQSGISTRAQMALTNRLRLEGNAAQTLTGSSQSVSQNSGMQSNLELKYRLLGP